MDDILKMSVLPATHGGLFRRSPACVSCVCLRSLTVGRSAPSPSFVLVVQNFESERSSGPANVDNAGVHRRTKQPTPKKRGMGFAGVARQRKERPHKGLRPLDSVQCLQTVAPSRQRTDLSEGCAHLRRPYALAPLCC